MSAADNDALGRRFFAEQDQLRGGPAEDLCAPGYTAEINAFPIMDWAGHHGFALGFYAAFPDAYHTIEDTVASDSKVAVRFRIRGSHKGDFMGLPPSGRPVDVVATAVMHVVDGKVTSLCAVFDQATLMQQLTA